MEFLTEQRELFVAKCARGESNFAGLLRKSLQNLGMTVSLIYRGIRGQAVEVAFAFDVIQPYAFGTFDDYVEGMIIMSAILVFQLDEVSGAHGFLD
jgi:hypothetical protein